MYNCRWCDQPLTRLYPGAVYELQWAHTTLEDAQHCPCATELQQWPIPALPSWTRSD
jgi:hypothetical protein